MMGREAQSERDREGWKREARERETGQRNTKKAKGGGDPDGGRDGWETEQPCVGSAASSTAGEF